MPDFYIRSSEALKKTGSQGVVQPHSFVAIARPESKDGWMQRNYWEKRVGWKEWLLCDDCEKRFGVHESKVVNFLYGSARTPLKKKTLGTTVASLPPRAFPGLLEIREVQVDYRELKLFQMSLLWRAGVAKGEFFQNVDLGEKHERQLRQFLGHDDPGPEEAYPCAMYDLRSMHVEFEGFWQAPTIDRDEDQGQRLYKIVIGGYALMYSVSTHAASQLVLTYCAKRNGRMFLPVVNGELFLERCAMRLREAGKL
jgi:hypothetical protein